MPAEVVTLECSKCAHRNYTTRKNKKQNPDRLLLSKYCPFCRTHVDHKERK